MATRHEYTTEHLEAIAEKLKSMPKVEKKHQRHSKQSAVKFLATEIGLMQQRGYTIEAIAEALKGEGFDIATTTLKNYLQRAKASKIPEKTTIRAKKTPTAKSKQSTQSQRMAADKDDASKASFSINEDTDDI